MQKQPSISKRQTEPVRKRKMDPEEVGSNKRRTLEDKEEEQTRSEAMETKIKIKNTQSEPQKKNGTVVCIFYVNPYGVNHPCFPYGPATLPPGSNLRDGIVWVGEIAARCFNCCEGVHLVQCCLACASCCRCTTSSKDKVIDG